MSTKIPNQVALPTSIRKRSNLSVGGTTLTTMDFGTTNVGYFLELLPTSKVNAKVSSFVQLAPMVVPTMGSCTLHTRAFFVPYRFVWNAYEDFASNKTYHKDNVLDGVPYITPVDLCNFMFPYSGDTVPDVGFSNDMYEVMPDSSTAYDFNLAFIPDPQDPTATRNAHIRLTPYGRDCFSILRSIGYTVLPFCSQLATSDYIDTSKKISALPLLAFLKVFRDYYVNPNYEYRSVDELLTKGSSYHVKYQDLNLIFTTCHYAWYDADVFTSAWANPEVVGYSPDFYKAVTVVSKIFDIGAVDDNTIYSALASTSSSYKTVLVDNSTDRVPRITQEGLNVLKAVRNIVMRQNAAGGRYIDQLLSKYGIRLPSNEARRSQFIGYADSKLNISRVDATAAGQGADGNNSSLGDFVGRGTMSGDGSFSFDNDKNDYGCIIVINHIIPATHYYQGLNPILNHIKLEQFWNGDLETTANAPIPYDAVYGQYTDAASYMRDKDGNYLGSNFGYSANYWEYKVGRDILSGDFLLGSRNTELDSFHMFRKLAPASTLADQANAAVLSPQFQQMSADNVASYVKIFNETSSFNCHFIVQQLYDVNHNAPCFSLQETTLAELKEHGDDVGSLVTVRPNGQYF